VREYGVAVEDAPFVVSATAGTNVAFNNVGIAEGVVGVGPDGV
jgi:hypothetical protein